MNYLIILISTLLSGWLDSKGFLHADKTWSHNSLSVQNLLLTYLYFGAGILFYLVAIKFAKNIIDIPPVLQTATWFVTVMIGLAIAQNTFSQWKRLEQLVAIFILAGIIWLILQGKQT